MLNLIKLTLVSFSFLLAFVLFVPNGPIAPNCASASTGCDGNVTSYDYYTQCDPLNEDCDTFYRTKPDCGCEEMTHGKDAQIPNSCGGEGGGGDCSPPDDGDGDNEPCEKE